MTEPTLEEIEERVALDDHSGAVKLARARLEALPDDLRAKELLLRSERVLGDMYLGSLGDLRRRPRLRMAPQSLQWLSIDHRAGFLVSRIDGATSLEDLLEISSMPRLDALAILHALLEQGVIAIE